MNEQISHTDFLENAWQGLRRATVDKKHPFRYFSLASAQPKASLRQRMVALRKIDSDNHLWIYTDYRSEKIAHFEARPEASLLFFHPRQWLQIQVEAEVCIHYQDAESQQIWKGISEHARKDYSTQKPPGTVMSEGESPQYLSEGENYFCRVEFIPKNLEILQIRREGHRRARFIYSESSWQGSWLIP